MPKSIPQIVISKIPTAAELTSPTLPIPCSVKNCDSVLTNTGTLYLHMLKHHNIDTRESNSKAVRFFCPEETCKYSENVQPNAKSFSSKKYLKQHYMKVHAKKTLPCSRCDKIFSSQSFKSAHESICGQQFICCECNWTYKSKEALMTHCRRKNHPYMRPIENGKELIVHSAVNKLVEIAPKPSSSTSTDKSVGSSALLCTKTQSTQTLPVDNSDTNFLDHWNKLATEPSPNKDSKLSRVKPKCVKSEQTSTSNKTFRNLDIFDTESSTLMTISSYAQTDKNLNNLNYVEDDSLSYFGSENFQTELCHNETQTEYRLFQENINESTSSDQLDQMLYSNMHTQTCDEILSELGLADIQTQTNWPVTDYSDLLVSTETQTIDSTFLLGNSSSTQTQTIWENF
ncbi:ATM interactor [Bradysia coprophila]|uniref:ATM interactor n=1 Tax=Bradysia coprophila TaxID=38358 RepID=UPI00187DD04E|nr:ATM interactor [Bradysia coprophila]XP_037032703.1 ATM interactor [Bradysia coprophila]